MLNTGPCRNINQVELSLTDARTIGVKIPVRESGDIAGSTPVKLVGPCGEVELTEGAIAAKRHIHMTPEDAKEFGVENGQIVSVKVENETGRGLVFLDQLLEFHQNVFSNAY
ncbi:MAG: PduL/EutD family phosphate acyltransferase [Bacilli bacterium]